MPDHNTSGPLGRIAVVDLGSNSLRLVVFERLGATLVPLLNEKVMGALGRGITTTGRLKISRSAASVTSELQPFRKNVYRDGGVGATETG